MCSFTDCHCQSAMLLRMLKRGTGFLAVQLRELCCVQMAVGKLRRSHTRFLLDRGPLSALIWDWLTEFCYWELQDHYAKFERP